MKKQLLFSILALTCLTAHARTRKPSCQLDITPKWTKLDSDKHAQEFGGKWVEVAEIVIKRRDKEFIRLEEIDLAWHGEEIKNLVASLFRKEQNRDLIPVEESLICDGTWNRKDQVLKLHFEEKEYLQPTTIFCLVLTVPDDLEPRLKKGHFDLLPESLPHQLRPAVEKKNLRISMLASNSRTSRKHRLTRLS
jgi:hypothetical protein